MVTSGAVSTAADCRKYDDLWWRKGPNGRKYGDNKVNLNWSVVVIALIVELLLLSILGVELAKIFLNGAL